ncbi:MAG TPA: hypothetical protein VLX60_04020 [Terriglobales bacterium]|nr:hypothetical protein [Terriglobales bacterium]
MSNLSFARIMYGAAQEQRDSTLAPVSNFPSHFAAAPDASVSTSQADASSPRESLLHKAWQALLRHN